MAYEPELDKICFFDSSKCSHKFPSVFLCNLSVKKEMDTPTNEKIEIFISGSFLQKCLYFLGLNFFDKMIRPNKVAHGLQNTIKNEVGQP